MDSNNPNELSWGQRAFNANHPGLNRGAMFDYDVCLSFAGEDRDYVREVADALQAKGVRVFFDEYEAVNLWGKDLYEHLDEVYRRSARYCILFISSAYANKVWTSHERKSAQARALREGIEYILPARFDDTEIPGLRNTVGYVDLRGLSAVDFARMVAKKIKVEPSSVIHASNASLQSATSTNSPTNDAALRPRASDGPLEVFRKNQGALILLPLEGGGRLALEVGPVTGVALADALKAATRYR